MFICNRYIDCKHIFRYLAHNILIFVSSSVFEGYVFTYCEIIASRFLNDGIFKIYHFYFCFNFYDISLTSLFLSSHILRLDKNKDSIIVPFMLLFSKKYVQRMEQTVPQILFLKSGE